MAWPLMWAASGAFLLATGLGARRAQAMPRWLWVVTVVLGVLALLGPGAFVFWLIAPVWFVVVGITLDHRGEGVPDQVTGAAPAASPGLPH
jgi:fatty acid desaturase